MEMERIPMIQGKKYIYLGKNSELHTHGSTYRFIESGYHWWKELGFVIWVTTNEYPNSKDSDFGCAFPPAEFKRYFWEA